MRTLDIVKKIGSIPSLENSITSLDQFNAKSLKIASAIALIAGSWSLLFEIFYFHFFELDIYFARVAFTIISLTIFLFSFKNLSKLCSTILIHLLIISLISSFIYTIYKIPNTLFINSQILSLLIFTTALIFSWEVKNQIIVAIYYNILFAGSIIFNSSNIFLLPNLFSITIFVCLISLLSVVASAVNYNLRKNYKSKTDEINFIFNSIPIGICRTDFKGNILTRNKFLDIILGNDESEGGANLIEMIKDEKFNECYSLRNESDENAREFSIEYKNPSGKRIHLRVISNYKMTDSNNKYIDFIIKDETSEILALNEQKEITTKLIKETKEKERLAEMRLNEKNQKLQLLAKINHEVRTPLNSILLFHEMVDEGILKSAEEIRKYSKSVKASSGHLLNTINNFIDYAKIETGKMALDMELFNIKEDVENLIQLLRPLTFGKKIELNLTVSENSPNLVFSDQIKIRQILTNLIANSIKFTRAGSVNVILMNEKVSGIHHILTVIIEDTGIGIPADKIDSIFDPFIGSNAGEMTQHSSGLGLAICKEFIQMLNGEITVTSNIKQGTKFMVKIPYEYDFPKINYISSAPPHLENN